jgi:hypothetical protein
METAKVKKSGIGRDVVLIIIGALISFLTSFMTMRFQHSQERIKVEREKKFEVYKDVTDYLGNSYRILFNYETQLKHNRTVSGAKENDSLMQLAIDKYNLNKFDLRARIVYYYNEQTFIEFTELHTSLITTMSDMLKRPDSSFLYSDQLNNRMLKHVDDLMAFTSKVHAKSLE